MRSGFFTSVNGDRTYTSDFFADYFASLVGNGVFPNPSDGMQVVTSDGLNLVVNEGKAWINGHILHVDNDQTLELNTGNNLLPRIDKVVVRLNLSDREITLGIKEGTPSSNPVSPILQRDGEIYELGLADIRVEVNSTSVAQRDITDLRWNPNQCGIVTGLVDQIDTIGLYDQYRDYFESRKVEFEEWFNTVENVLDDSTGGELFNMVNDLEGDINNLETTTSIIREDLDTESTRVRSLEESKMDDSRITISSSDANVDLMEDGDIWLKYGDN